MSNVNRLADILNRSKAVMDVTIDKGSNSNNNTPHQTNEYGEKEVPNLSENYIKKNSGGVKSVAPKGGQYRNVSTSKMPQQIINAMIENQIEIPESPNHTFDLSDVQGLVNESVPTQPTTFTGEHIPADGKSIREIVREEIGDVVREVVEEYLDKSLVTEDIKIKIGDTVFGGKLKPLPTKKKKRV